MTEQLLDNSRKQQCNPVVHKISIQPSDHQPEGYTLVLLAEQLLHGNQVLTLFRNIFLYQLLYLPFAYLSSSVLQAHLFNQLVDRTYIFLDPQIVHCLPAP